LDSTGLVLLTNDGDLAGRLLHPRFHVEKEYIVIVRGLVKEAALEGLRRGVLLEDGMTAPARVELVEIGRQSGGGPRTTLKVVLHEGRKRQVRRMMEAVGHRVVTLHRTRFDRLTDTGLLPGQARKLSVEELEGLRTHAGV
jgi:23S rRNA pseudouridine2605 synthase